MKILYLADTDPRMTGSGSRQRTHWLWKALSEIGETYVWCREGDLAETSRIRKGLDQEKNAFRRMVNAACRRFLRMMNPVLGSYCQLPFPRDLGTLQPFPETEFDCIVMRYMYRLGWLRMPAGVPVYVDVDDWPPESLETRACSRLARFLLPLSRRLLAKTMRMAYGKMHGGWIARKDNQVGDAILQRLAFLPNLPLTQGVRMRDDLPRTHLLTVGNMSYGPNCRGVEDFLRKIWPAFHRRHPEIRYVIVGRGAPPRLSRRWKRTPGVDYLGFVPELSSVYSSALGCVVPVTGGSGTSIKTMESLALGRLCLAPAFGFRGIPADEIRADNGMLCYDSAASFDHQVSSVLLSSERRSAGETGARNYSAERWTFQRFSAAVQHGIEEYQSPSSGIMRL